MPQHVALELAVQDLDGLRVARDVGADRVELCTALGATGGVTPGAGLIEQVAEAAAGSPGRPAVPVHVLIRPRPGGYVLGPGELDLQVREVRAALRAGAAGVVVGALTAERTVDRTALDRLVDAADGADVTFHRALDLVADPEGTLEVLAAAGVRRVLTSGGHPRAVDGVEVLARLARAAATLAAGAAGSGIEVMAGGGVRPADVPDLVAAGVNAVHLSAKRTVADDGGPGGGGAATREMTDPGLAAAAASALRGQAEPAVPA